MRSIFIILSFLLLSHLKAQELYVYTEPASNMATGSLGLRLNNYFMPMTWQSNRVTYRLDPELMWGVSKKWMVHVNFYASNMFTSTFKFEGGSLYAKYRFLSKDDIHKHFRMAAFGKVSLIDNPFTMQHTEKHLYPDGNGGFYEHTLLTSHSSDEQNLDGNHSGWQLGIIATQLIDKLALSGSLSSIVRWNNLGGNEKYVGDPPGALQTTLSAGYLLLPRNYESYRQTNMNLYAELIMQKPYDHPGFFVDAAPAVQFIFNSICRLDLGYRFQLGGNLDRFNTQQWLVRIEYNWLNLLSKKKEGK